MGAGCLALCMWFEDKNWQTLLLVLSLFNEGIFFSALFFSIVKKILNL